MSDDPADVQALIDVFADASEAAIAVRLPVVAALTESDKSWAAIAHPLGGSDVEGRAVAAVEGSQLLKPLLDHGAAGGMLKLGHGGTNITAHKIASGLVADSLREALLIEGNIDRRAIESTVHRNLRRLIATVRGRSYSPWMVMGIDFNMQPDIRLRLPWGRLLSPLVQTSGIAMLVGPLLAVRVSVRSYLNGLRDDQPYVAAEARADRALLLFSCAIELAFDDVMPPVQRWRAILGPARTAWSYGAHPATRFTAKALHPTTFLKLRDGHHGWKSFMTLDLTLQLSVLRALGPNGIRGKTS